jgi:cation transport regulator ChaB
MQYDCVECLPDSVKASLDEKGQKMWMDAFNSIVKKSAPKKTYREAVFDAWQMVKTYPGCRFFSGFVSTEDLDKQNDVVAVEKAYERIINHVNRGGTMVDTHTNRTVGAFVFAEKVLNKTGKAGIKAYSVVYQGEPYYDTVWGQIKKGIDCPTCGDVRKGYSIGGFALDAKNVCDITGCHREIIDMSIHEISVCQDPANPEAVIQEVNMMAKSESEATEKTNAINKDLRPPGDAPAQPEMMAQPQGPAANAQPAAPAIEAKTAPEMAQVKEQKAPLDMKSLLQQLKEAKSWKEQYDKLAEIAATMNLGATGSVPQAGVAKADLTDVEKAGPKCGCTSDLHTSVTDECPKEPELNGDVNDPQVANTMSFLENKDIEADESAEKETKKDNLMPGKDDLHFKGTETATEGKTSEEGKNPTSTEKVEALEGTDGQKITVTDLKEPGTEPKHEVPSKKVDQTMPEKPKTETKTINEKGDPREKNFGKEGKEVFMKMDVPDELMPLFKEFLQSKGIKLEPEVKSPAIEAPMEKTLYTDDDISELDLMQLSNPIEFDSSEALGKSAIQRLKVHNMMARMRLAKTLKVADIEFLVPDIKKVVMGADGKPTELPENPEPVSHENQMGQAKKLTRMAGQPMVQLGRANAVWDKYINKCPKCGKLSYLQVGDEGGCRKCGYSNVPHTNSHTEAQQKKTI